MKMNEVPFVSLIMVHQTFPTEPSRFMLGPSPTFTPLHLPWQIAGNFQKAPCCPSSMPLKCCTCALETPILAFSTLLSASHYWRHSSGSYLLLKGAFPESRLCPFHVLPWATCIYHIWALITLLCVCQSVLLSRRQYCSYTQAGRALPSSKPPNLGLVFKRPLSWLPSGWAPSPWSNKSEKLRDVPSWSPGNPFCATLCGARTPDSRFPCPNDPKPALTAWASLPSLPFWGRAVLHRLHCWAWRMVSDVCLGIYICAHKTLWDVGQDCSGGREGARPGVRSQPVQSHNTEESEISKSKAIPTAGSSGELKADVDEGRGMCGQQVPNLGW